MCLLFALDILFDTRTHTHTLRKEVKNTQRKFDDVNAELETQTKAFDEEKHTMALRIEYLESAVEHQTNLKSTYDRILKHVLIKRFCKSVREKKLLRSLYFKLITATTECLYAIHETAPAKLLSVQGFDLDALETRVRRRVTAWPWLERPMHRNRKDATVNMLKQVDNESVLVIDSINQITELVKHWRASSNNLFTESVSIKADMLEHDAKATTQLKLRLTAQEALKEERTLVKKLTWELEKAKKEVAESEKKLLTRHGSYTRKHKRDAEGQGLAVENKVLFSRGVELKRRVVQLEEQVEGLEQRKALLERQRDHFEEELEQQRAEISGGSAPKRSSRVSIQRVDDPALPYLKTRNIRLHSVGETNFGKNGGVPVVDTTSASVNSNRAHALPHPPKTHRAKNTPKTRSSLYRQTSVGRSSSVRKSSKPNAHTQDGGGGSNSDFSLSFALLMPDVLEHEATRRAIMKRLKENGFGVVEQRMLRLTLQQAEALNIEFENVPAFREMCEYQAGGAPVIGLCVMTRTSSDCVPSLKKLVGQSGADITELREREPVCLKAKFGESDVRCAVQCSVSRAHAAKQIEMFFGRFEDRDMPEKSAVPSKSSAMSMLQMYRMSKKPVRRLRESVGHSYR
jgi:nucleoside diphosphate kinase